VAYLTGLTLGQKPWTPQFVKSISPDLCIGCGRCFKACGRDVLQLKPLNEDGEFVEDEDDDEFERMVMTVANANNCIGCEACARSCTRNALTHEPYELN